MDNTLVTDKSEPRFLIVLKGLIRPVLTLGFFVLFLYVILWKPDLKEKYVDMIYNSMWIIILFWFAERSLRNIGFGDFLIKLTTSKQNDTGSKAVSTIHKIKGSM